MKALWKLWPGIIMPETCRQLVANAMEIQGQPASIGGNAYEPTVRESELRWIYRQTDGFGSLWTAIEDFFRQANDELFFVEADYIESLQFTTYHSQRLGHYRWHTDVFWEADRVKDRKLSMVLQLADEKTYEGGALELDCHIPPPSDDLRLQGSVIVFPAFVHHRVLPVTQGIRHSIVAWQEGPRWR